MVQPNEVSHAPIEEPCVLMQATQNSVDHKERVYTREMTCWEVEEIERVNGKCDQIVSYTCISHV